MELSKKFPRAYALKYAARKSGNTDVMSIELSHQTLVEIGLGHLSASHQSRLLQRILEVLEARVGVALVEHMTSRQADNIDAMIDTASPPDDRRLEQFLENEIPEYPQLVRDELALMLSHIQQRLRDAHGPTETDGRYD